MLSGIDGPTRSNGSGSVRKDHQWGRRQEGDHSRGCAASLISCLQMHFLADHAIKSCHQSHSLPVRLLGGEGGLEGGEAGRVLIPTAKP